MSRVQHVLGLPLVEERALQEEGDDPLAEAVARLLEIDPGDVSESADMEIAVRYLGERASRA